MDYFYNVTCVATKGTFNDSGEFEEYYDLGRAMSAWHVTSCKSLQQCKAAINKHIEQLLKRPGHYKIVESKDGEDEAYFLVRSCKSDGTFEKFGNEFHFVISEERFFEE